MSAVMWRREAELRYQQGMRELTELREGVELPTEVAHQRIAVCASLFGAAGAAAEIARAASVIGRS